MKKTIIVISLLLSCCFLGGWTMWIPDIGAGDMFEFYPIQMDSNSPMYSYDTLSDFCASINENIASGSFNDYFPFSDYSGGFHADIVSYGSYSPARYVIRLRCYNSTYGPWYLAVQGGSTVYAVRDVDNPSKLKPLFDLVSSITADIDHIDTMLTTSLPALFKTTTGSGTYTVADLEYNIWQSVDGLEDALSTISGKLTYSNQSVAYYAYMINSRVNTTNSRLLATVNGTSYSAAALLGNIWQAVDGIEGQLDNIYSRQQDTIDAIYEASQDIISNSKELVLISNDYKDQNDDILEHRTIPYESATDICAYLNENFYSKKIDIIDPNTGVKATRWFVHSYITNSGLIGVKYSSFNTAGSSSYTGYLCDKNIVLLEAKQPTYIQYLTATVNNADVSLAALLASVDANITTMSADVDAMASAVANINTKINAGLTLQFGDSSSNPIYTSQVGNDLYLSSYATDNEGVSYDLISSPYQSTTDIIGYINSEMVGKAITRLPRRGDTRDGEMVCYVDHAYLDNNNMIRVAARNALGTLAQYFLCSPEMALYQSIAQPLLDLSSISAYIQDIDTEIHSTNNALGRLEVYTDGIEGLIRTGNQSLSNIQTNTDYIKLIDQAILNHLDSSDLVDDAFISDMVEDWGDNLVYTVLSSDNVLSLFNAAFGDLPSDLDWAGARGFFEAFYRGDE